MKTAHIFTGIILSMILMGCHKDDDPLPEAQIIPEPELEETNAKPSMAVLTSPEDEKELVSTLPILRWNASIDSEGLAVTYTVAMGTSAGTLNTIAESISSTEFQLESMLEKGTKLYWNVIAKDVAGETTTSDTHNFSTEFITTSEITDDAPFSKRSFSTVTTFQGKLWLIGGQDEDGNELADIWSSTDGENWEKVTEVASFGNLILHNTLVFDNKLWVFNGSAGNFRNKIWFSENGKDWSMATETTPFYNQFGTMFVFDNKIWRLAGYEGSIDDLSPERYIWNSPDGLHWTKVSENHGFDQKYGMAVVPFKGKLIGLEGSEIGSHKFTKVRESSDGIHWSVIAENLPFVFGSYTDGAVLNDKLYITTGSGYGEFWFTEDGSTWRKAVSDRGYPERYAGSSAVLDNKIFIVGGGTHRDGYNDVWVLE